MDSLRTGGVVVDNEQTTVGPARRSHLFPAGG